MRTSWLRLYAPFLVLALVQGLFIAVAPSRGGGDQALSTFGSAPVGNAPVAGAPAAGGSGNLAPAAGGPSQAPLTGGASSTPAPTPSGSSGVATAPSGTSSGGGSSTASGDGTSSGPVAPAEDDGGGEAAAPAQGDTSHCTPDGLQFAVVRGGGPPCVPKWPDGADNGGATYTGVTEDTIKVVVFSSEPNEQVNTILAAEGLATSEEETVAAYDAYFQFLNERFETYGRTVEWKRIVGDCPTTPPDYDACIAAAQEVVKEKPFVVIWGTSLYASVYDVWAKNGIISLGGQHFEERFFTQRRPYRYDIAMDGTQSADHIAEYYCKKMAGNNASHSGQLIHPTIGARGQVPRKLGIVVPEIEANVLNAQRVQSQVAACGDAKPAIFTYESDIERANEQTQAVVSGLIDSGATTVTCMCDPIAPAFLTKGLTQNNYFPEFLMPGLGLLDYDKLGRLYDQAQMEHAFGPSHLGLNVPLDDSDAARVWREVGNEGHPCGQNGCQIPWSYVELLGSALHMAGPQLDPLTFEHAILEGMPDKGGTPDDPLADFGPNDYTGLGDAKEVYWSNSAPSSIDGRPGSFIALNDGARIRLGQWGSSLDGIPVGA